jgi:hypothetical protein
VNYETFNTIAACVSAIAACFAAYFAARALQASNEITRSAFAAARPYFTFLSFGLKRPTVTKALTSDTEILDPTVGFIDGYIRNSGGRPAANVSGSIFVIPLDTRRESRVFPIGIADDAAPGSDWNVVSGKLQIIPREFPGVDAAPDYVDPGLFVVVGIVYDDPLGTGSFSQASFHRWPGIANGVVSSNLVAATADEKEVLIRQHGRMLAPFVASVR